MDQGQAAPGSQLGDSGRVYGPLLKPQVAALGLGAVLLVQLLRRMQARALLRLHAAEAEMAEVARRGRERDRDPEEDRDRHRLLQLLHGHAETARRHVRRLSMPWHGYAAAPHGAQPSSGRDPERELDAALDAAVAHERRRTGSVAREELLDPRLVSREASPDALRSTQGSTSPGAGAGARARTPSPAPLPASRDRSLWSLLLGGQ